MEKLPVSAADIEKLYDSLYEIKEELDRILQFLDSRYADTLTAEKRLSANRGPGTDTGRDSPHTIEGLLEKIISGDKT